MGLWLGALWALPSRQALGEEAGQPWEEADNHHSPLGAEEGQTPSPVVSQGCTLSGGVNNTPAKLIPAEVLWL